MKCKNRRVNFRSFKRLRSPGDDHGAARAVPGHVATRERAGMAPQGSRGAGVHGADHREASGHAQEAECDPRASVDVFEGPADAATDALPYDLPYIRGQV